jgi:hypothetical protein
VLLTPVEIRSLGVVSREEARYLPRMPWLTINIAVPTTWIAWFTTYKDVLGVLVAAVGIPILLFQITQGASQERERLRRRRIAATATLPLTLSTLSGYPQGMMSALGPIQYWAAHRQAGADSVFDAPAVPAGAIFSVEQMIEAAPTDAVARSLAAIVSDIQVLSSRTNGLRSGNASELRAQCSMVDDNVILAAKIYARIGRLFDYARTYSDEPDPPIARVRSALNLAGLRDGQYRVFTKR